MGNAWARAGYAGRPGWRRGRLTQGFPRGNGWATRAFAPFVGPLARVPNLVRLICLLQEGPSPGVLCGVAKPTEGCARLELPGPALCSILQRLAGRCLPRPCPAYDARSAMVMPQLLALRPGLALGLSDSQWEGCRCDPCGIMHVLCP